MSPDAHVTERFTLVNPDTMTYEMTYSDPKVWTKPMTLRMDWPRNEKYKFFEYACHEGNYGMAGILSGERMREKKAAEQSGGNR